MLLSFYILKETYVVDEELVVLSMRSELYREPITNIAQVTNNIEEQGI